jgi:hypothetical protein
MIINYSRPIADRYNTFFLQFAKQFLTKIEIALQVTEIIVLNAGLTFDKLA